MSPLSSHAIVGVIALTLGAAGGWTINGWRSTATVATEQRDIAQERADHSKAARTAEADQRSIEFNRQEAINAAFYQYRQELDKARAYGRDRDAAVAGLRNALAAAEFRASGGQAGSDPEARTGADDARTLRIVAEECAAEYGAMADSAIEAGITVTGLQEYALKLQGSVLPKHALENRATFAAGKM